MDEIKNDKFAGFFIGAGKLGYSMEDTWKLMLNSRQGLGLLNDEYAYVVHHSGEATAIKADEEYGNSYKKQKPEKRTYEEMFLLGDFIENANKNFHLNYKDIFHNISITDFVNQCGYVLGNYDDKLIKRYLLGIGMDI